MAGRNREEVVEMDEVRGQDFVADADANDTALTL